MKKRCVLTVILISAMALVTLFAAACTTDKKNVKFYASGCDHEWVNDENFYIEATCTERGQSREICTICGEVRNTVYTAALGHILVTESHSATCTEYGYSKTYCTREGCGYTSTDDGDQILAAHSWSSEPLVMTPASCEESGYIVYVCEVCGEEETVTLNPLGHTWVYSGETTITGDDGEETAAFLYKCSKCGATKVVAYTNDADDVCEHNWGSKWYSAEYTYNGMVFPVRYKVCKKCGEFGCFETVSGNSSSLPWYVILIIVLLAMVIIALLVYIVYKSTNRRKNTD